MATIGSTLADQFERGFDALRENIEGLTDKQWTSEAVMVPARYAYHAIQASSNYNRTTREEPFARLSTDWEGAVDQLPKRGEVLEYLETVRCEIRETLTSLPDEWFMEPTAFEWTGSNRLGQYVYSLRHLMYHSGEVSMALRVFGAEETGWR